MSEFSEAELEYIQLAAQRAAERNRMLQDLKVLKSLRRSARAARRNARSTWQIYEDFRRDLVEQIAAWNRDANRLGIEPIRLSDNDA